ncbi:MAG: uroporphyrinogen-III C-methyltransferase [Rhodospirillaceae bacterium]|nr:uroporphyrinogen-III C-methyltransferase [Rhodospirillaceae bacterium]|tara:strand:- start:13650 stop:14429 length:780 start_codon:yes stop_codon:yes gene_type:complete
MNAPLVKFPDFLPGSVWIAGAGPGDPTLLTLGVHNGLQMADVIVYDALVDQRILDLAACGAVLEYAGKRGGRPSTDQADISQKLVALARNKKRVLRLKGGDPMVFGRGPQECEALINADIPFRILPGITAGVGGLAYAGIPVTSRDTNAAVTFLTGHTASGNIPDDVDWESLSKGASTLVVYMGSKHLRHIRDRLLDAGRPANEPVAIISKATTNNQRTVTSTLETCAESLAENELQAPMIIVIGPTVEYHEAFSWFSP